MGINLIDLKRVYEHVIQPYLFKAEKEVLDYLKIEPSKRGCIGRDGYAVHITNDLVNNPEAILLCTSFRVRFEDLERNNLDIHFKNIGKLFIDQLKNYNVKEISEISICSEQEIGMLSLCWVVFYKIIGEKK